MADTVITGPVNPETAAPETGATVDEPRGDDDVILRMDAVVGGYGATTVLHETSFEVHRNALTTIIGPNGAGKSTAIKAIFGMVRVRSGHVWYEDEDIVGLSQIELLRRGISFVPQGRNVFPRMSVRANLELGGVSLGNLRADPRTGRQHRLRAVPDAPREGRQAGEHAQRR